MFLDIAIFCGKRVCQTIKFSNSNKFTVQLIKNGQAVLKCQNFQLKLTYPTFEWLYRLIWPRYMQRCLKTSHILQPATSRTGMAYLILKIIGICLEFWNWNFWLWLTTKVPIKKKSKINGNFQQSYISNGDIRLKLR